MPSNFPRFHPGDPRSLLPFVLATFNTAGLVLLILLFAYRGGGLDDELDDLSTLTGLGLFGYLWLITWFTTSRALRAFESLTSPRWWEVARAGVVWGGLSGVIFLTGAIVFFAVAAFMTAAATLDRQDAIGSGLVIFYGAIALPFAFIVGAAIGFAVAFIDYILLRLANLAAPPPALPPPTNGTSDV